MLDPRIERPRFCAQCGSPVVVPDANYCKNCGAPLTWLSRDISWRPLWAVFLSVIPGLGQLYKGQPARGLLWFIFVVVFLLYATPIGVLLWMICAGNAALAGAMPGETIATATRRSRRRRRHTLSMPGA
ncbi:MAG: zinc ribbon domain-containing protein [Deltaproteobacteria bacterium]|nr:zinc ribbon domain-containing protein [Deltaproteobacteria bacterium]